MITLSHSPEKREKWGNIKKWLYFIKLYFNLFHSHMTWKWIAQAQHVDFYKIIISVLTGKVGLVSAILKYKISTSGSQTSHKFATNSVSYLCLFCCLAKRCRPVPVQGNFSPVIQNPYFISMEKNFVKNIKPPSDLTQDIGKIVFPKI